ncbi:MAG: lipid-A-disaccharide synthase [Bdellovibrionota bacterium]
MSKRPSCFISVGEHSGDLLAAELVLHLKKNIPELDIFGVTGNSLREAGVTSVGSIDELSVMGIVEVLKKLPALLAFEQRLLHEIDRRNVEVAILVDFPGFHFRLAEELHLRGIKVVQYVAPKLWAWGIGRAKKLKEYFDLVLGVLPFETEFFSSLGVNYKYIGSPHLDRIQQLNNSHVQFSFTDSDQVIACLPGSRLDEVNRMMPVIYKVATLLKDEDPRLNFVVPISSNLSINQVINCMRRVGIVHDLIELTNNGNGLWRYGNVYFVKGLSLELMSIAKMAVIASGTATLECALLGTPMVVLYAMDDMSYKIARKKVTISDYSLVNIVAQKKIVTEFIQHFTVFDVVKEVSRLMHNEDEYLAMKNEFFLLTKKLTNNAGFHAAAEIVELIGRA